MNTESHWTVVRTGLPSVCWRILVVPFIAVALLLTGLTLQASPASATVVLPGANAGPWPSTWTQYTYQDGTRISDLNGDQTPVGLDLASGTCAPAPCAGPESSVAYKSDGTNAFFRMRMAVDNNDATKGGLFQGAFLVQIANAAGVVKAVVGVDGKDAHTDMVYVADSVGGTVVPVYEFPFTVGSPSSAAMRWIPAGDGTGQYFLDFQVPLSALNTVSGGAVTATSKIKLYYGSSAAANLATINKDLMLGNVTSADFTDVKLIQFVPTVYTVAFDSTGGSPVASQNVNDGDPVVQPTAPTRTGYVFDGWWSAASGGTQWSFTTPITGPATLHAHWKNVWSVAFDSQGGSAVASQNVVDGSRPQTRPTRHAPVTSSTAGSPRPPAAASGASRPRSRRRRRCTRIGRSVARSRSIPTAAPPSPRRSSATGASRLLRPTRRGPGTTSPPGTPAPTRSASRAP